MSLTLAINACEGHLQIALGKDGVALCVQDWAAPSRGTEILAPAVAEICARLGEKPAEISRVACARGPGSFTGIRLALSFAAALKRANNAELAGIDYMGLLAFGARDMLAPGDVLWVFTHARRDLLHCRGFNHKLEPISEIELISPEEAAGRVDGGAASTTGSDGSAVRAAASSLAVSGGEVFILGSGLARQRDFFAARLPQARFLPERLNNPHPADLFILAEKASYGQADIDPLYIRPCDAVENLTHISLKAGRDPEQDRAELDLLLGDTTRA